jgi:putative transposase
MHEIINAILYVSRTGCQWRFIPHDFPVWQTVYGYFRAWSKNGTWIKIHDILRGRVRVQAGHEEQPSAGCMDSQSVKTTEQSPSSTIGYDVHKATKGRKRHTLVDTLGLILKLVVTHAGLQDRDGAMLLLDKVRNLYPKLQHILADGAYAGTMVKWAKQPCQGDIKSL